MGNSGSGLTNRTRLLHRCLDFTEHTNQIELAPEYPPYLETTLASRLPDLDTCHMLRHLIIRLTNEREPRNRSPRSTVQSTELVRSHQDQHSLIKARSTSKNVVKRGRCRLD
jgi:hypothetical protein